MKGRRERGRESADCFCSWFHSVHVFFYLFSVGLSHPYVVLEQSVYQVTEEEGEVKVCAVLSGDLGPFQHVVGGLQTLPASAASPAQGKTV